MKTMPTISHHEDIVAWQLATELKERCFKVIARPSVARHFRFCDQLRDSSRSAPANISEGFWRYRPRDNARFVRIALGSLGETANHLRDAWKEKYIEEKEYKDLAALANRAIGVTIGWHAYLMSCPERKDVSRESEAKSDRTETKPKRKPKTKPKLKPKPKPKREPEQPET